jgi:hypothetical protein
MVTTGLPKARWSLFKDNQQDCSGYLIASVTDADQPRFEVLVECGDKRFIHETLFDRVSAERRLAAHHAILISKGWNRRFNGI